MSGAASSAAAAAAAYPLCAHNLFPLLLFPTHDHWGASCTFFWLSSVRRYEVGGKEKTGNGRLQHSSNGEWNGQQLHPVLHRNGHIARRGGLCAADKGRREQWRRDGAQAVAEHLRLQYGRVAHRPHLHQPDVCGRLPAAGADVHEDHHGEEQRQVAVVGQQQQGHCLQRDQQGQSQLSVDATVQQIGQRADAVAHAEGDVHLREGVYGGPVDEAQVDHRREEEVYADTKGKVVEKDECRVEEAPLSAALVFVHR